MFCFSIKMIHNCKYLKLKMRVVSDKGAQLLNVTQSLRVVVFTCFEPKKESFVAQPGLTEWQEWTNRGWRWCLLTLSMFWLLWAVITSHCMYHFWNPLGRNWWPFLVRALPWWCSLGVRVLRWPVVVWKIQIQQTDAAGWKKSIGEVCICRVQIQKPSQQWSLLPSISLFLSLPPLLWSLWRFWGACSDVRVLADILNLLCGGLAFVLMFLSGAYLLVMHQEKVDSFCHWPLLIDPEGSSLRSVDFRRQWRYFHVFVLLCLRTASAVDGWTSVQKKWTEFVDRDTLEKIIILICIQ